MKLHLFTVVAVFMLCNDGFTELLFAQQVPSGNSSTDSTRNSTDMNYGEYHEVQPITVFKPELIIPDSLLNESFPVKVWVKIEVDSLGTPLSYDIIKSSNERFNDLAGRYALEYRFKLNHEMSKTFHGLVSMPIIFNRNI